MITNQSLNRSGLIRISTSTYETYQQTDPVVVDQPKIWKKYEIALKKSQLHVQVYPV